MIFSVIIWALAIFVLDTSEEALKREEEIAEQERYNLLLINQRGSTANVAYLCFKCWEVLESCKLQSSDRATLSIFKSEFKDPARELRDVSAVILLSFSL